MAIPNQTITMHHMGSVTEDIPMGIHSKDFRYLADVLNGLYSDTIAAPIREYATNAWDSHVEAGVTRPIEITLPTSDRLEFVVQDFGLGMSVDDLRNTYAFYGASDKRDSNAVAGQLGLGSKSGLAYAEAFTVTAVKGGVKTVAMVTKDEHGIGIIKVLDTLGTDDPNGVRITIPVDRYDVDDFHTAATALFQFWSPGTVLIDGKIPATPEWATSALRIDPDTWLVRSDAGLYSSYVIMGNVAYPVPDSTDSHGASRRFVARLNIGDVDFVPSREDVKHTRHTDETLSDLYDYIRTHFRRVLDAAISGATSAWEEAQVKMLWKGLHGATLRTVDHDRKIWTFNPSVSWGRKSQAHNNYRLHNLISSNIVVITGFSAKTLSSVAKDRLTERFGDKAFFVIIPSNTKGTHMLDGRPNVHTWESVVGATSKPKAARGSRGPKVETIYTVWGQAGMTADELSALSGKVLYVDSGKSVNYGSLGATAIVCLYSTNQLARIKRYVPDIIRYSDEVETQRKAALRAITPHDRAIAQARTLPGVLKALDHNKVDDPDLAEHIRLAGMPDTDTMIAAHSFSITFSYGTIADYGVSYPLAIRSSGYYNTPSAQDLNEERLFYINAKWQAEQAKVLAETAQETS